MAKRSIAINLTGSRLRFLFKAKLFIQPFDFPYFRPSKTNHSFSDPFYPEKEVRPVPSPFKKP